MYDVILSNISRYVQLSATETDLFKSLLQPITILTRQYLLQAGDIACDEERYLAFPELFSDNVNSMQLAMDS